MQELFDSIRRLAPHVRTVLVDGETGTGKELVARGLHRASARSDHPFLALNCAAMPEPLLESELFGHRRGAFTGAIRDNPGLFRAAAGGVVFLDEVADMPVSMQAKLLRVLEEQEVVPLGDSFPRKVDVRVLSATNRDLRAEVAAGRFREDLYYRLAVFPISLPPLRERREDIPLLCAHFIAKLGPKTNPKIRGVGDAALGRIMAYHWPGNVRELENTLERAVLMCDGQVIHGHHLPPSLQTAEASGTVTRVSLSDAVAGFEKDLIQDALKTTRGNRAKAARLLDTTERVLNYKVRKYTIDVRRFTA